MSEQQQRITEYLRSLIYGLPKTPKIMHELVAFLKEKGHSCACINKNKLLWCEQDKCRNIEWQEHVNQVESENNKLIARLESGGHQCIDIIEAIPSQIRWCHQNLCEVVTNANLNSHTN